MNQTSLKILPRLLEKSNVIFQTGGSANGVDLKETADGILVIEVNDNPSIEHGVVDEVIGDALYDRIIGEFLLRIEAGKQQTVKK